MTYIAPRNYEFIVIREEKMNKKSMKKNLALFVALLLTVSAFGTSFAAAFDDLNKAPWASETIDQWSEYGFVSGYGDGTFRPLDEITRAEFAVLAYNAFSLESKFGLNFSDVKSSDWFYDSVVKMSKLGYITGYEDGTFRPNAPIKRSEAVAIIANILGLEANVEGAKIFADYEAIPDWVKGQVGASAMAKFVTGYTDGTFKAEDTINRAESVAMLNNAVYSSNMLSSSWRIVEAGTYGGTEAAPVVIAGNVVIKTADVVLNNVEIKGNLTIGVEVGEGDVNLNNVTVAGDTNVFGGGVNSVEINGGSYGKVFVMKKTDTPVRLLVVNAKGVDVVLPLNAPGRSVVLEGIFNSVSVLAANADIKTQGNTTIKEMILAPTSIGITLNLGEGTVVAKIEINVVLTVLGQGRIITAEVNVSNVVFEKQPEVVNNQPTTPVPPVTPGEGTVTPPPATVYVNYMFQAQKNSENIQNVKTMNLAKGTTLSFTLISQMYDSFSSIPFGYESISELLMLTNPNNGGKTYAEGLASKVKAIAMDPNNNLKALKYAISEFDAVSLDPTNKAKVDALANKLLGFPLSDILDDLALIYDGVEVPSRIKFMFADRNSASLDLVTVSGTVLVSDIQNMITTALDGINLENLAGKRAMKVIIDQGTPDEKSFTVWVNK